MVSWDALVSPKTTKRKENIMKKSKKLFSMMAFSALVCFGVASCGGNGGQSQQTSGAQEKITITAAGGKSKLIKGETVQLTASVDGVTWESSKPEVATVSETGLVTSVGEGKAAITAKKNGYKDGNFTITVELQKIVVSAAGEKTTLTVDETVQLSADQQGVSWVSSDPTIASVSEAGLVTAIKAGQTTIKASKDGYGDGSIAITVNRPAPVATLKMEDADHYSADGWWANGTIGPGATPIYARTSGNASDAQCIAYFDNGDKETLKFNSSAAIAAEITVKMAYSSEVADLSTVENVKFNDVAINLSGVGYAFASSSDFVEISLGNVNVKSGENVLEFNFLAAAPYLDDVVIYSKQQANISLIPAPVKSVITVDKDSINVETGKTATITVTNTTGATFVSDKEDIATVDAAGVVTGVSMGSANIIVKKDGFYSAKVAVTVTEVQEAGEIRLEAELAEEVVAGTSSFMNLTDSTSGITRPHSGGGYISGYNVSGEEVLTFKFNADAAQAGKYELSVNGSPAYGITTDFMFKDSCSITLNTNAVSINADAKIAAGDGSMSAPRVDATLGEVTIVAGENTLVVTFHGSAPSLDFFRLVPKA